MRILAAVVLAAAPAARAADKPVVGPPAAWVLPPPASPAPAKAAAGASASILFEDFQVRFDANGQEVYAAFQGKVQAAAGLAALGTLPLIWAPATDTLTVHRVRILRGDQVIDCLPKDGVFNVLRREANLEGAATLDGILTAVIQPEGLQVGDRLDVAYSVHRDDPVLRGHADAALSGFDGFPVGRLRLRAIWPKSLPMRWRESEGLTAPVTATRDGQVEATVEGEEVTPLARPKGAPARFQRGRELAFSSYAEWAQVSALFAPLYVQAARLPPGSSVLAEARAIAAASPDPAVRAAAALRLVQEKVRYLAQLMGAGGLTPTAADVTWSRRYGDCKAKTVLLLALLHELGVTAEPVLVSAAAGDGLDGRLPAVSVFDHVLVRATIRGRDYWLDGTRLGDTSLEAISTPNFGFVLPLRAQGAALLRLTPEPAKQPLASTSLRLDASKGLSLPAPAHAEFVVRGDGATALRLKAADLAPDDLQRELKAYWSGQYDFITPATVSARFDPATGEERWTMDGSAKLDWSGGYEADGASLGWKLDIARDPGPHADAPFAVAFPAYTAAEETILLPQKGVGFTVSGDDVDKELAGHAFHRRARIADGAFHLEASTRALKPEITLAEAKADVDAMAALAKTTVRVKAPANLARSPEELKAITQTSPSDAAGYIDRGNAFMDSQDYHRAVADFDQAVQREPQNVYAWADRGLVHAWLNEPNDAERDLNRAEAIDPKCPVIWRARGLLAEQRRASAEAVAAFTRSLVLEPDNAFALLHRAQAEERLASYDAALADMDAAMRNGADGAFVHGMKADLYGRKGDLAKLRDEAALAAIPGQTDEDRRIALLDHLYYTGHKAEARAEVDRMLATAPTAELYLRRGLFREADDLPGTEADAKAAAALDPKAYAPLATLANISLRRGDLAGASVYAAKAATVAPDQVDVQVIRARIAAKSGDKAAMLAAYAKIRAQPHLSAETLNNLCWEQATAGVQLDQALADCEKAAALAPSSAPILDSRAFVLLRLGRDREARAGYDAALALRPDQAASLYGRSLAARRLGDVAAADADLKAAAAKDPKVVETFAGYGVAR